jgi:ABC-type transport system involved in multi-copper enzyme maturation permease subunit
VRQPRDPRLNPDPPRLRPLRLVVRRFVDWRRWSFSKWNTVPALVAILTTIMGLMITGLSVAREREVGTFDQLLVSPLSPTEILVGKKAPAMLIGTAQATAMTLVGVFAIRVPFRGSVALLYLTMEGWNKCLLLTRRDEP